MNGDACVRGILNASHREIDELPTFYSTRCMYNFVSIPMRDIDQSNEIPQLQAKCRQICSFHFWARKRNTQFNTDLLLVV